MRARRVGPTEEQQAEPKKERRQFNFHFLVDVTTLLASIATVIALMIVIHDRRDQADIAAWTLLQGYLHQEHRAVYNEGQSFALETLVQNGVSLEHLDAHGADIPNADLHGANASGASFTGAALRTVNLSDVELSGTDLEGATLTDCVCQGAHFTGANLARTAIIGGDFGDASFSLSDVSDLIVFGVRIDRDAFKDACFRQGHPLGAVSPDRFAAPGNPQSYDCKVRWGAKWAALEKAGTRN
jgi:hypothetical protein